MTVWKWRTSGVPESLAQSGVPVSSAFMPLITKTAGTWQAYKQHVTGQPGTQGIPAPNNDIPSSPLLVSADHRSSDAPPRWYPSLYFQDRLPGLPFPAGGNDAGVQIHSDNQLPWPAVEPQRGGRRFGGGEVVQPYYDVPHGRPKVRRRVSKRHA